VQQASSAAVILRFGAFELDLQNNELRRAGVLLKLSPQQFQVLRLLAENAGQLETREDIQREVWGADTFVDFDRNLNVCVAQIRATLNDDSDAPRFIQTVPKRGYKFIAPVERVAAGASELPVMQPARAWTRPKWLWFAAALAPCVVISIVWATWPRSARPARTMIAALPFENLTGDPKEDLFTDGLTEELISQLGSLNPERVGVIGRTSVMRYKSAPHGIDQVGHELRVDYILEGTVRRSDGRIRIAARLIKVADQAQVWTDTSERAEAEMFRIEEESAAHIASAVSGKLVGGIVASRAASHARNQEAYQAYLNGLYLEHKETRADLERSVDYFEEAAKLDPQFDPAYSSAAEVRVAMGRSGAAPPETWKRALEAAEKALSINALNAEAHNALANVLFWREWNWPLAEQHFTHALAINPSLPVAHHDYAFFLVAMGRTEQGLTSLRRAIALDPLSARVNIDAGWLYLQAHHFDDAIRQARRARELEPTLAEANACILRALFYQKKYREIADTLHLAAGNPEETLKRMYGQRLQDEEKSGSSDLFSMATQYTFLGQNAKALDALDRAYAERSIMMPLLKTEPAFEALHGEARFQELARKLALP
jgi:TolB-like protein/DNA-binding winged helix-turn-helix (wHTH) protein/Tfp pilus assembly protein PilF